MFRKPSSTAAWTATTGSRVTKKGPSMMSTCHGCPFFLDEKTREAWRVEASRAYPKLRGRYAPSDLFDQVLRLTEEFRKSKAQPRQPSD